MKIIRDNKVYVQEKDFIPLFKLVMSGKVIVPNTISNIVFSRNYFPVSTVGHEFIEYSVDEVIEFFRSLDFIIDYDDVSNMSKKDLKEYIRTLSRDAQIISSKVNEESKNKLELLSLKIDDILGYLNHLKGKQKIIFPPFIIEEKKDSPKKRCVFALPCFKRGGINERYKGHV